MPSAGARASPARWTVRAGAGTAVGRPSRWTRSCLRVHKGAQAPRAKGRESTVDGGLRAG